MGTLIGRALRGSRRLAGLLLSVPVALAAAAPGDPVEAELDFNPYSYVSPRDGVVTLANDGGSFVVAWVQDGPGGTDVYAQRHDAFGRQLGGEFRVHASAAGAQTSPALATRRGGDFSITWLSDPLDGSGARVVARHYRADGQPQGSEFFVSFPGGAAHSPSIDGDAYLAAVHAWVQETGNPGEYRVLARRMFNGNPQDDEIVVDTVTASAPPRVDVSMVEDYHRFVVAWNGIAAGNLTSDIWVRRYDLNQPASPPVRANTTLGLDLTAPAISGIGDGQFVAVWQQPGPWEGQDDVAGQRFDFDVAPLGSEFIVNTLPYGAQTAPDVAMARDGSFTVTWQSDEWSGGFDLEVRAQRYDAQGLPDGGEIAVPTASETNQVTPRVAADADGDLLVVWTNTENYWPVMPGIRGQRLQGPADVDLALTLTESEPGPVSQGGWRSYRFDIANLFPGPVEWPRDDGVGAASGLRVVTTLPEGFSVYGSSGSWSCDQPPVCEAWYALEPGGYMDPLVLALEAPQVSGEYEVTFTLGGQQFDAAAANNSITLPITVGDASPDPFAFLDRTGVARSAEQTSDAITVAGIEVPTPIAIYDQGSYSVNGGVFTTEPGSVSAGDSVRVRHTSAATWSTTVHSQLWIGDAVDTFSTTTADEDLVPDAFAFAAQQGVEPGAVVTSAPATITGINGPATVSVASGSYSVDGAAFTTAPGTIVDGQAVRVRHAAAAGFAQAAQTTLTIGGVQASFASTTRDADVTPDAFAFTDVSGSARGVPVISGEITIGGLEAATTISVAGGSYSVDGGAFTTANGAVAAGQRVRVQHVSSNAFATATDTTLTIGGVSDTFTSTTVAQDTTPDAWSFADVSGAARSSTQTSAPVTIGGINAPAPVSVAGGLYSIDGGAFQSTPGTISAGQSVRVQHTASSAFSSAVDTTLTIGGVSDTFTSVTGPADTTPDPFTFTDRTGLNRNTVVISNTITITGINAAATVTVSGGNAAWSKNGGAFTSAAGTVVNGDGVRVRVTSASTKATTVNVTVSIGGVTDVWSVRTQ